ncbi:putative DCC family thiol-disulfide oxidoreductase YuxK [Roseibium hamelinense]|uniref:Putative DCC family thiol-disulfide oxidoreductase YuxK n=1 Tax=Roseibium hamelinense TaxID=150831 RepID=A0A562TAQ0_9HYPH|nr:DCC1-like thiol-disulfide oxidoreductase family protein [Roseibium hamelinense]MTI45361.1 DUF393 domain-containing protein [Roseibium hamelinense]TWI90268.1 putative DCC family thiol-disulfide oxidoreductase YuxK [Roseibium hamelinense]
MQSNQTTFSEDGIPEGNLIVFDGVCILCSGFARFMAKRDKHAGFRFVDAQSPLGRSIYRHYKLDPDAMETNIVIQNGKAFVKMSAFTAAMKSLGWPWKALTALDHLPTAFSDWMYDRIARNRYRFGRRSCSLPSHELKKRLIE